MTGIRWDYGDTLPNPLSGETFGRLGTTVAETFSLFKKRG
jgi:hypothetical protein